MADADVSRLERLIFALVIGHLVGHYIFGSPFMHIARYTLTRLYGE